LGSQPATQSEQNLMSIFLDFAKKTVIGGLIFLLPLGLAVFAIGELMDLVSGLSDRLGDLLFPNSDAPIISLLISASLLLTVAFLAGLLATTALGDSLYERFEKVAKSAIPGYSVIRQTVSDMSGSSRHITASGNERIVKVRLGQVERFGYLSDQLANGDMVVYLPSAPSVFTGIVVLVKPELVSETTVDSSQLMRAMGMLGHGLDEKDIT